MGVSVNKILQGDALEVLKILKAQSVDCSISSPPYWGLRDYGVDGQLGLEADFDQYIGKLCDIYDEVRRVLKPSGTCFVNLGDSYSSSGGRGSGGEDSMGSTSLDYVRNQRRTGKVNLPVKSLCMIPYRFAIEMVNRGWILRNIVIWHKPNVMPSSADDRFTVDFEPIFLFSKSKNYFFEQQLEPLAEETMKRNLYGHSGGGPYALGRERSPGEFGDPAGRNKRCVWPIPTNSYAEAHFATYPEDLVIPMIKSGCPEFICVKCRKSRKLIVEASGGSVGEEWNEHEQYAAKGQSINSSAKGGNGYKREVKGLTDCGCGAGFEGGVVLDPFSGAGTTCMVAKKLNRKYIGIEINKEYIQMAQDRIDSECGTLL